MTISRLRAGEKRQSVLKLTNNILSAVALAATSEAFVMGAKGGLDPETMVSAISAGSGRNSAGALRHQSATLDEVPDPVVAAIVHDPAPAVPANRPSPATSSE